jgi:hypothetical protein
VTIVPSAFMAVKGDRRVLRKIKDSEQLSILKVKGKEKRNLQDEL